MLLGILEELIVCAKEGWGIGVHCFAKKLILFGTGSKVPLADLI